MSGRTLEGRAMKADEWDFTTRDDEVLNPPDVYRCERARDVGDRLLEASINSVCELASTWQGAGRVALVCAHMLASAIAYGTDRLAESHAAPHAQKPTDA